MHVIPGQDVRRGEVIAASGASGRVTAPHLHFEVRMGNVPVNPYPYLAKSAVYTAAVRRDLPF
jgi:murein DD-endopeptidase MepM/ murein hydrolase activator NlpD